MNQKVTPVITYLNLSVNKSHIYIYNKKKSGIYRWTNLIDGKSYVGSSIKLNRRLSDYFCIDRFKRIRIKGRSRINEAILKYGISTFSLDILEYCESNVIIEREQYYLDLLKPEYNIRKIANSPLGRKMPEEAKINISIKNKGVNDPVQG
jgi:group I intron endonuclease